MAEQHLERLATDGARAHPEDSRSTALQKAATESANKKLAAESDSSKRAETAADTFWGFDFINVRSRPDFCAGQGVSIDAFVEAFEKAHLPEVARAKEIYRASSGSSRVTAIMRSIKAAASP